MKSLTKKAILQTFRELLEEMPFDKITVSALVRRTGIHHNTFYYHYQNIDQLLDEWMAQEIGRYAKADSPDTWDENVKGLLWACKNNRKMVNHILQSLRRDQLERFLFSAANDVFDQYVAKAARGRGLSPEQMADIADFCRYAFFGYFLKFLWNNMEDDIDRSVEKLRALFFGFVSHAIDQYAPPRPPV